MTWRVCLLAILVLVLGQLEAQANECASKLITSPFDNWIDDGTKIRLSDEARRAHYARALLEKFDLVYVPSASSFKPTKIRLSSLYTFMSGDPMNVRRFISTAAQNDRANALRKELFGISKAGMIGRPPPAGEVQIIRNLVDDEAAARLMRGHWLSEFPAFVINNGPGGKLREYWRLKANAGDYLFDDSLYDNLQLIDLADLGMAIRSFHIDRGGQVVTRTEDSLLSALSALEQNKSTTCSAQLEFRRIWLDRRFVEKYAGADRTGNVHYHGQVSAWDDLVSSGMNDPTLFPLIRNAYMVSAVTLSVLDEVITVDWLTLTPLVASQH